MISWGWICRRQGILRLCAASQPRSELSARRRVLSAMEDSSPFYGPSTSRSAQDEASTSTSLPDLVEDVHDRNRKAMDAIQAEIASSQPLVNVDEPIESLLEEYSENPDFIPKIKDLCNQYRGLRRLRRDGNCFFRAFMYSLLELLSIHKDRYARLKANVEEYYQILLDSGYQKLTLDDFYDTFCETLLVHAEENAKDFIHKKMVDPYISDYCVVFLRLILSAHLQKEALFYENFIEGHPSMKDFCSTEVEPMYRESDNIHIIGLTSALGVNIRVEHLARHQAVMGSHHDFPENNEPRHVYVLYRPGHYDVLYKRNGADS